MIDLKNDLPDFEKLDQNHRFMDRRKKLNLSRRLGYTHITHAIYMLYYGDGYTIRGLGAIMGFSPSALLNLFKVMKWKARSRGGASGRAKLFPHITPILQAWYASKKKTSAEHTQFYVEQGALYNVNPLTVKALITWKSWVAEHHSFLKGAELPAPLCVPATPELTLGVVQEMRKEHLARVARAGDDEENGPGRFYPISWNVYGQLLSIAIDTLQKEDFHGGS